VVWIVFAQAMTGRWSLHTALEIGLLFILPFTAAIAAVCVPVFLLAGRSGGPLSSRAAAVWAGASLSAILATAQLALFFTADSDSPRTSSELIEYWPFLAMYAIPGGIFGLVWSQRAGSPGQ
jgi:hypothetical protein